MTSNEASRWFVYMAECADGTYYCGVTTDVPKRMDQHNGRKPGGAKYTRSRRPVGLLAYVACENRSAACMLEYAIKAAPREKKLAILSRHGSDRGVSASVNADS